MEAKLESAQKLYEEHLAKLDALEKRLEAAKKPERETLNLVGLQII